MPSPHAPCTQVAQLCRFLQAAGDMVIEGDDEFAGFWHLQPSCKNVCQGKCFSGCKAISSPGRSRAHPYQRPLRRDNPFFPSVPTLQPLHIEPKIPSLNLGDSKDGMIDRRPTPPNAVRFPKMELPMAGGPAWADANGGVTPFASELFKRVFGKRLKALEDEEVFCLVLHVSL